VSKLFSREGFDPKRVIPIAIFLLLLVALMLVEFTNLEASIQKGEYPKSRISARLFEVRNDLRKFVSITALMGLCGATANVILLFILGVDYPALWEIGGIPCRK
jgi:predicted PurR-regulated permease PerM